MATGNKLSETVQLRVWATLWFQLLLGDLNPAAAPFSTREAVAPPPPRAGRRARRAEGRRRAPPRAGGGAARRSQVEAGPSCGPSCLPLRPWIVCAPPLVCASCWATSAAARPGLSYPLGCAGLRLEGRWSPGRSVRPLPPRRGPGMVTALRCSRRRAGEDGASSGASAGCSGRCGVTPVPAPVGLGFPTCHPGCLLSEVWSFSELGRA